MDTLNYLLFKNPVSSTLIQGTSGALSAVGITAKSPSSSSAAGQVVLKEVLRPFQSLGCNRVYIRFAGLSGAAATILGAIGAHRQFPHESAAEQKRVFETANRFHFMSTMALIAIPFTRKPHLTGTLLITGTLLFCGPMYYRALTNDTKNRINRVVPFGGAIIITAWLTMVL